MSDLYGKLIEATLQHLEGLQARGVKYVTVSPGSLDALRAPRRLKATADSRGAGMARLGIGNSESRVPGTSRPRPYVESSLNPRDVQAPQAIIPEQAPASPLPAAPTVQTITPPSAEKLAAIAELRQRALACVRCPHLASSRKQVVFGVGNINAELMFVGEAPGADEDAQGEPFVGRAGQLLTKIIETMGLSREVVYIGNILKCRPDTPGKPSGNRKPTPAEMETCIPYLHEQIDLIKPKVLVGLGGTAMEGLLGKVEGIMKLRGRWHTYRGIPLMPTFHPAYVLRNQALSEKRKVWEDMLKVMEKLGMPVSEKQQKFFLKG